MRWEVGGVLVTPPYLKIQTINLDAYNLAGAYRTPWHTTQMNVSKST